MMTVYFLSLVILISTITFSFATEGKIPFLSRFFRSRSPSVSDRRDFRTSFSQSLAEANGKGSDFKDLLLGHSQEGFEIEKQQLGLVLIFMLKLLNVVAVGIVFRSILKDIAKLLGDVLNKVKSSIVDGDVQTVDQIGVMALLQERNATLTEHENSLLSTVVLPSTATASWDNLGGLHSIKASLKLAANLNKLDLVNKSDLMQPMRSVLLFGPPGCGKTVFTHTTIEDDFNLIYPLGKSALIHGLCKCMDMPMLHITPSSLLRKFVGETSLRTKAVFSLASKLQPCIIFIDELDSLFRSREAEMNPVERNLMTECKLWSLDLPFFITFPHRSL
jgi:hypothetical protein